MNKITPHLPQRSVFPRVKTAGFSTVFNSSVVFNSFDNRESVQELECPMSLKHEFLKVVSIPNSVFRKDSSIAKLDMLFQKYASKNREVSQFLEKLHKFKQDDSIMALYIKNQPYHPNYPDYADCFIRMIFETLSLEYTGSNLLCGEDGAVEVFHADRGLQGIPRLKDVFAISCLMNTHTIPLVVLPWLSIRSALTLETVESLRYMTQSFYGSEGLRCDVPVLSVDRHGEELFFFDEGLSLSGSTQYDAINSLRDTIQRLDKTHSIRVYIQPGETVVVKNLKGLHRRGIKKNIMGTTSRKVVRYDALNLHHEGLSASFR